VSIAMSMTSLVRWQPWPWTESRARARCWSSWRCPFTAPTRFGINSLPATALGENPDLAILWCRPSSRWN